ncbi:hypothetical protein D3C81_1023960 [compost metagenome]
MADDHRVIGNLHSRWRQLTYRDLAFWHLYLAGYRQLVINQAQGQVGGNLQRGVRLHRHR